MNSFNLVNDPWIPVRWRDGRPATMVSLAKVFAQGEEIADLACAPHERVALMRLLVCVTQAAAGAPKSANDWPSWQPDWKRGVLDYLERWKKTFDLLGEFPRFLQVPIDSTKQNPLIEFLEFKMLSNERLFDHLAGTHQIHKTGKIALNLLAFQNFFLPGSTGSPANGGVKGSGPSINYLHTFLIGSSILDTIVANSLDEKTILSHFKSFGRPVWELKYDNIESTQTETEDTYLGRLVPLTCAVKLNEDRTRFSLAQGVHFSEFGENLLRDASATIVKIERKEKTYLSLLKGDAGRSIWRDLHTICILKILNGEQTVHPTPLIIQSHIDDPSFQSDSLSLWCGELVRSKDSSGKPTAKISDTIESVFHFPKDLFTLEGQARYENGVIFATSMESRLLQAVQDYNWELKPKPGGNKRILPESLSGFKLAQQAYWNQLDQECGILLNLVRLIATPDDPMPTADFGQRQESGDFDPWTQRVRRAAKKAYEDTCPARTPRQHKAHVAGLRVLFPPPKKSTATTKKKP